MNYMTVQHIYTSHTSSNQLITQQSMNQSINFDRHAATYNA